MRYHFPNSGSVLSAGSLSSMIDIVFLLIIFFVVTASFDREQIDAEVALPSVAAAPVKSLPPQRVMVNVFADGAVKIGFRRLRENEVKRELPGILKTLRGGTNTVLVVNGDRDAPHKYIAAVMNAAARAGFSHVRINAEVGKREP